MITQCFNGPSMVLQTKHFMENALYDIDAMQISKIINSVLFYFLSYSGQVTDDAQNMVIDVTWDLCVIDCRHNMV